MWRRACSRSVFTSVKPLPPCFPGIVALMWSPGWRIGRGLERAAKETIEAPNRVGGCRNPEETRVGPRCPRRCGTGPSGDRERPVAAERVQQAALPFELVGQAGRRKAEVISLQVVGAGQHGEPRD